MSCAYPCTTGKRTSRISDHSMWYPANLKVATPKPSADNNSQLSAVRVHRTLSTEHYQNSHLYDYLANKSYLNMNPQILSNDLTIAFGILASLLALAGILVAVYLYRQHFRIGAQHSESGAFGPQHHEPRGLERCKITFSTTPTLH